MMITLPTIATAILCLASLAAFVACLEREMERPTDSQIDPEDRESRRHSLFLILLGGFITVVCVGMICLTIQLSILAPKGGSHLQSTHDPKKVTSSEPR